VTNRHPSVDAVTKYLDEIAHLPDSLFNIANHCKTLMHLMLAELEDDPELTAGFRKLLEAKDCFVRAAVAQENRRKGIQNEGTPL